MAKSQDEGFKKTLRKMLSSEPMSNEYVAREKKNLDELLDELGEKVGNKKKED